MMAEGEAEQFSLRWNNFHSNLTAGFHALLQGEDLVDVTLAADGQFIRAHKIVLSVCSPYFKELFKVNPCKHPIVILKDVSHKDLVAILQFMYQGEVNVRQEELTTFLKTAEMLQIKGLTGDDSANEEETLPVPPTPVQRPRVVRRVVEKAPHAARATVEKKQQPATELLTVEPEEAPAQPPYKRIRPEVSTASPVVTEEKVAPTRSSGSVEFVEISKPKMEPVEFETEIQEIESTPSNRDDPLVQLLGGESSQSMQDSSQGTGLFASIPGVSQDSGLSQDSGQAIKEEDPLMQSHSKSMENNITFRSDWNPGRIRTPSVLPSYICRLPGKRQKDCCVCDRRLQGIRRRSRTACTKCGRGLHLHCAYMHPCGMEISGSPSVPPPHLLTGLANFDSSAGNQW